MRISDWSSDVCSSDLGDGVENIADEQVLVRVPHRQQRRAIVAGHRRGRRGDRRVKQGRGGVYRHFTNATATIVISHTQADYRHFRFTPALSSFRLRLEGAGRSEEHTSELKSLMRLSYAVFCLKKKR